ncbi:RcnB family protein [Novosphingobium profundi]|uniref:RcnB family protein n=1 Tax=Novosphingobium profundi TaxID=1774954 RepID=UPI001BD9C830|nr:RcnB family protein [Novosphingobium profundi]MBT0669790.1 RcnB family protein [Novosphingobium profundi]
MNKFTATLMAASLALPAFAAPAMAAPQQHGQPNHGQQVSQAAHKDNGYKSFKKGDKFDRNHARNYQVVDYKHFKKLPAPKRGYRYVRSGSDVLLIGTSSLKVYAVYGGLFR